VHRLGTRSWVVTDGVFVEVVLAHPEQVSELVQQRLVDDVAQSVTAAGRSLRRPRCAASHRTSGRPDRSTSPVAPSLATARMRASGDHVVGDVAYVADLVLPA